MTLPSSGQIAASDINVELGRAWNHWFDMNAAAERNLAGKPSGAISFWDFYGKSNLIREPAGGENYARYSYEWYTESNGKVTLYWGSALPITGGNLGVNTTALVVGTWTYYRGSRRGGSVIYNTYGIYRVGKY